MSKLNWAIYYGDKQNSGQYDNGVWMHLLNIPFITRIEEAGPYDGVIRTLWLDAVGWSREIRNRWPSKIQIGLSDHPLSTHISKLHPKQQIAYFSDLENLDGIMALTEEERQFYQIALPSKSVIKAGLPFPFEAYDKLYGKFIGSEKKWVGLGVGAADNDRNFISSAIVFQRLKLEYPDLQGVFLSVPSNMISSVAPYCDLIPDTFIHERNGMGEYYDLLSQCKLVINMADRNTPGRLQGEAAYFEVPVVGSERLELQNELFPKWTTSPYSLEEALDYSRWIIENPGPAQDEAKSAKKKLQVYNYSASKRRFNKLLKMIEERG